MVIAYHCAEDSVDSLVQSVAVSGEETFHVAVRPLEVEFGVFTVRLLSHSIACFP